MTQRTAVPGPATDTTPSLDGAFKLVVWMSVVLVALLVGVQRSVDAALAGYQCQGDAMFQQDFAFRID